MYVNDDADVINFSFIFDSENGRVGSINVIAVNIQARQTKL